MCVMAKAAASAACGIIHACGSGRASVEPGKGFAGPNLLCAYSRIGATMTPQQPSDIDQLIETAATVPLVQAEMDVVIEHVARVGFAVHTHERVRGRLAGMAWHGRTLRGSDMLPPADVHYLWHVVRRREWPEGTSLANYLESLRSVVLDAASGIPLGRCQVAR